MESGSFLQNLSASIQKNGLFGKEDKLLCAISGGLDSMVMAHALHSLGFSLEIAHINFELRGEDSFLDEKLVSEWADKYQLPFHLKRAGDSVKKMPGSLQENARDFRYAWLEKLAAERNIRHLLLAHHAGDQTETLLLQYFRGAGLQGMQGIRAINELRKRPLLPFTKAELLDYAGQTALVWREDVSNAGEAYRRNKVRHRLVPLLEEIFPGFESVLQRNAKRMDLLSRAVEPLFHQLYALFLKEDGKGKKEFFLNAIAAHPQGAYFFCELLERNGFPFSDALDLLRDLEKTECRTRQNSHGLVLELRFPRLLLHFNPAPSLPAIFIEKPKSQESQDFRLADGFQLQVSSVPSIASGLDKDKRCFSASIDLLQFPLCFRPWKAGDRMAVKGMGGRKKNVSDILSEAGLTAAEKAACCLLEDASGNILWIPGLRQAEMPEPKAGEALLLNFAYSLA
jgi:tRNA(Ile)-lysidine synthase